MDITCIIPCYGRPLRTLRAIESVISQEFNGEGEALFIGDGCPYFQKYLDEGVFNKYIEKFSNIKFINLEENKGGWGSHVRKIGIDIAKGKYICFLDNDDVILSNHFENYYTFMHLNPHLDFGYFNSYIFPTQEIRNSYLGPCAIGHAELIIKKEVLQQEYEIDNEYLHDWRLIEKLIKNKYKHSKCRNAPTYIVKSIPSHREEGID